ncbi:ATPase [Branchiibius sp. NY16-3462-2]|nr:ATPase [Branchiibius sp. NY16-3462-2]
MRYQWHLPSALLSPVRAVPLVFAAFTMFGTVLLLLPWCHSPGADVTFMQAFFTATSAVTVTGLATVDIGSHFSWPGQLVILLLAEFGGIGIILVATTLGVLAGGRIGLRMKLASQTDLHVPGLGEVGPLFRRILLTTLFFQGVTAIILITRYRMTYFNSIGASAWHGIFDAVMAFNNAGLSLRSNGLAAYAADPIVVLTITIAVMFGTVGWPVLAELRRNWRRPATWTIHTRLTVWGSLLLVAVGWVAFLGFEWTNAGTIGTQSLPHKIMTGLEGSVMPRSGGLATFNWDHVRPETMLVTVVMMLIGGGSASTAGGIKVTTFFLLAYVVLAEVRGDEQVRIGRRAISARTVRTALSIALIGVALAAGGTLALLMMSDASLAEAAFEATSAFGTTGLSTGITPFLGVPAQLVLIALMFVGRVGTITAASAFAMRRRQSRYRLPDEQPIIG